MKKILIVTPKFPYPSYGACEQDRAAGIEMFKKMGYEVMVITKIYNAEYKNKVDEIAKRLDIKIVPICYKYLNVKTTQEKIILGLKRLFQPWYWDGAAFEYSESEIQNAVKNALNNFKPDVVWFDYTYLWPLYRLVKKKRIPIVTRSINFEPIHFLEEDGRTLLNYIKFLPKLLSEYITLHFSNLIFSITPNEEHIYRKLGAHQVFILPLRSLSRCINFKFVEHFNSILQVFFMGSTYNVAHNMAALKFLLIEIIPKINIKFPEFFQFNIFGAKIPEILKMHLSPSVKFVGFVPFENLSETLGYMDIAIVPSLYGAGMQQKIFEPLTRGFPTIVSSRGLAGYPFKDNEHLLLASTSDEFVNCLDRLRNRELRLKLSTNVKIATEKFFSYESIKKIVFDSFKLCNIHI